MGRTLSQRPPAQIVATLRARADTRAAPPGVGPLAPLADVCVHLRDVAPPLRLDVTPALEDWRLALGFLVSHRARVGLVPGVDSMGCSGGRTTRTGATAPGPS